MGQISLPLLDGTEHRGRKDFVLAGFTPEAYAAYLPSIEREVAGALAAWAARGEVSAVAETKRLALETICICILGIPRGPVLDAFAADYEIVLAGFSALPMPLPGTGYSKAKAALGRILARFETAIAEHLETPREDGLSRILAAKAQNGAGIGMAELKVELHHIVVAGLIVWSELTAMLLSLSENPDVHRRLAQEIVASPSEPLSPGALRRLPNLYQVVQETKRTCPIVPVFCGRARRISSYRASASPKGGWCSGAPDVASRGIDLSATGPLRPRSLLPRTGRRQETSFRLRAAGSGPMTGHKCPGLDFATLVMSAFAIELLRGYEWEIPETQDLSYNWSKIPPEPKSGLRVRLRPVG